MRARRSRLDCRQFRRLALFGKQLQLALLFGTPLRLVTGRALGGFPCARLSGRRTLFACAPRGGRSRLRIALGALTRGFGRDGSGVRTLARERFGMFFRGEPRLRRRVQTAFVFGALARQG